MTSREQTCPVCGRANQCRVANGAAYKGPCWCEAFTIPVEVQRQLAETCPERACLCLDCLRAFTTSSPIGITTEAGTFKESEDYYLDADGRMVFTATFLQKRGYCCDSGCRHCPYPKTPP